MSLVEVVPSNDIMSICRYEGGRYSERPREAVAALGSVASGLHDVLLDVDYLFADLFDVHVVEVELQLLHGLHVSHRVHCQRCVEVARQSKLIDLRVEIEAARRVELKVSALNFDNFNLSSNDSFGKLTLAVEVHPKLVL